jgi:glyceraldehyde-3-phosphate dehydrogenase/erythrose-4-phosphate dehydrogenase
MAHLLKYDSIHVLTYKVSADEKEFLWKTIFVFSWETNFRFRLESLDIDYVIEATLENKTFEELNTYNRRSKKVISAPSEVDP